MIQVKPITQANVGEYKPALDTLVAKIKQALQSPILAINPMKPKHILMIEKILDVMGTDDMPAQPLIVIPGLLIQAYVPHLEMIVSLLTPPKEAMQIQAFTITYKPSTLIDKNNSDNDTI